MNKVLILGVNGFIGKHFQNYIKKNNLNRSFNFLGADKIKNELVGIIGIKYQQADLSNYENLNNIILTYSPHYIINLTGISGLNDFDMTLSINAGISRNIFEVILKNKLLIKNILLIGSAAEYGLPTQLPVKEDSRVNPLNVYGLSKAIQTQYALFYYNYYNINMNVARTFNVIGKEMPVTLSIGSFLNQIHKARAVDTIYTGNLNTKRDFLDIEDVVDAYWKILINAKGGEIYNVCSGRSYYIRDVLNNLIQNSGKKIDVVTKDEYLKKNDVLDIYGDNTKLCSDTDWREKGDIDSMILKILI